MNNCATCGSDDAPNQCAGCRLLHYCSVECQTSDWKAHHEEEHGAEVEHAVSLNSVVDDAYQLIGARRSGTRRKSGGGGGATRKKKWIQSTHMHKGAFTREAEKRGLTPAEFQKRVLANKEDYDEHIVRQANLRRTLVRE